MFTRFTKSNDTCLLRKAMFVQRSLVARSKSCWLSLYKDTLCGTACGTAIWNEWWGTIDFRCECITTSINIDDSQSSQTSKSTSWEADIDEAVTLLFISSWQADLMRVGSKRGEGGNKLRTYNLFKSVFECEPYLKLVANRDKRVLLSKFRIGICPLRIETGRYEIVGTNKGLLASERTCLVCNGSEIEDEFHFLLKCPAYNTRRLHMLSIYKEIHKVSDSQLVDMFDDPSQLFASIMSSKKKEVIHSVGDYIWDSHLIREHILLDRNR